jgi:outer membrane protein
MQMKTTLLILGLAGLLAAPAPAQIAKFGVVDLRKVFDNYWKTKQADSNLKEEASGLDKEKKNMVDQFQKDQESYKKKLDSASDPAVSTEERDKRKKEAEDLLLKLREGQNNIEQFDRQARTTLAEKQRRMRDNLLGEIKDVVKAKANAGNYNYVLDTAAETVNNTPVILFSSGASDLTDEVLAQLNLTAPKSAPDSKPADSKPAKDDKK